MSPGKFKEIFCGVQEKKQIKYRAHGISSRTYFDQRI
jgi:hypothetical protein